MTPDEELEDTEFPPDIYDQEQIDLRKLEFDELYNDGRDESSQTLDNI